MRRRLAIGLALFLCLVTWAITQTAQAAPSPGATTGCSGVVCVAVSSPATTAAVAPGTGATLTYTIDVPGPVSSLVFQTHQDTQLPVQSGGVEVQLNGAPLGAASSTVTSGDATVTLTGPVAAGSYTVQLLVAATAAPSAAASGYQSWASATFATGGGPVAE